MTKSDDDIKKMRAEFKKVCIYTGIPWFVFCLICGIRTFGQWLFVFLFWAFFMFLMMIIMGSAYRGAQIGEIINDKYNRIKK